MKSYFYDDTSRIWRWLVGAAGSLLQEVIEEDPSPLGMETAVWTLKAGTAAAAAAPQEYA